MAPIAIIIGVVVVLALYVVSLYNGLVKLRNNRENAFADIDVQLKQRHDYRLFATYQISLMLSPSPYNKFKHLII